MLLDFAEHQARARSYGPCRREQRWPRLLRSGTRSRQSSAVPSAIAALKSLDVTPGFSPTSTFAPGRARNAYHISVLPRPPAACLVPRGIVVVRMHLHGEFVFGENEFHEQGKDRRRARPRFRPIRHGICGHASPSFCPANGPFANRQSLPVIHASPTGSASWIAQGRTAQATANPTGAG